MKRLFALVLVLALIGCGGSDSADTSDASSGDAALGGASSSEVAVYVNGSPIYREDAERLAQNLKQRNISPNPEVAGETLEEQYFNSAVRILENQRLVIQAAAEKGIAPSEDEINTQLTQVQMQAGGITAFTTQLEAQGLTEDDVKEELTNQLISRDYFAALKNEIQVDTETIQAFYDTSGLYTAQPQVRARHILKTLNPGADEATKQAVLADIQRVKARIEAGEAFEEVAKTESQGPSAPNGGDLGYFNQGAMVPPFDEAAFALEKGEISDPVLTRFGYHLIQLVDKRTSPARSFDEVRTEIELRLQNQMTQEAIQAEVERLREEAEFKYS